MDKKRYEQEIEEILRKAEEDGWASKSGTSKANAPDDAKPQRRPVPPSRPSRPPSSRSRFSPGTILGITVVALIVIVLMRPFAVALSVTLTPLAVVAVLGAVFYYYTSTSSGSKTEKRWRGQTVNMDNPSDPFAAIKRTLNRWLGRR